MTRTISLIIGITATALTIGVSPALGEGRLAGSPEPAAQVAPDWFERAAINAQNDAIVVSRPDSHDIVRGDFWNYDASGAKIANTSPGVSAEDLARLHGGGQPLVSRPDSHDIVTQVDSGYLDAAARAQRIDVVVPTASSDGHERSAPPRGEFTRQTDVSGSGTELELPQVGIGFGFGLLLALGLYLTMRYTRGGRELAH
jgi:hypothetical protein